MVHISSSELALLVIAFLEIIGQWVAIWSSTYSSRIAFWVADCQVAPCTATVSLFRPRVGSLALFLVQVYCLSRKGCNLSSLPRWLRRLLRQLFRDFGDSSFVRILAMCMWWVVQCDVLFLQGTLSPGPFPSGAFKSLMWVDWVIIPPLPPRQLRDNAFGFGHFILYTTRPYWMNPK